MKRRFDALGIGHRVNRFSAIVSADKHHVGCALSHRKIIQRAYDLGLSNALVLEDDVIFDISTLSHLNNSLKQIETVPWNILFLGAHVWGKQYQFVNDCEHLRIIKNHENGPTFTHAIAYNASSYTTMLNEFPDNAIAMTEYVENKYAAIDQYLALGTKLKRVITEPRITSQPPLLKQENASFKPLLINQFQRFSEETN